MGAMRLKSRIQEITAAKVPILTAAAEAGFDEREQDAINLALEEALANAIRHGNRDDAGKSIFVDYAVSPQDVRVTIRDEGDGFDPDNLPDPRQPGHQRRPSGRGILLLRTYMDEVLYNEKGNEVLLIKKKG
jgi:serine/threonine-protein kinase RsbW